ncbi:NfrA family protein [Variovorax sp. HJSM1_2]|uniref:NfrA family protein n=1 Tax=Variovorax sp. HJSM1_2 TaxID=3366263 RepID=UPI003BCD140E
MRLGQRRIRTIVSLALVGVSWGGASMPARAGWLHSEWQSYRIYPRLIEAERLLKLQRFDEARTLVEEAERIGPYDVNAAVLRFTICERQADTHCIRELADRWQTQRPDSGVGPAVRAYMAYNEGRAEEMSQLARTALERPDLPADARQSLSDGWVTGLIQFRRFDEAQNTLRWLEGHKIEFDVARQQAWQTVIADAAAQQARASTPPALAIAPPALAAASGTAAAPATPAIPAALRPPEEPSAQRPPEPASTTTRLAPPRPEKKDLAPAEVSPPPEAAILALINAGHYPQAVARVQELQAAGQLDASQREGLVLNLQRVNCGAVLDLVPPEASAPLTTARQQMAAGYCSEADPARAQSHFSTAISLANRDDALAAQALGGLGQAQIRLGDAAGAQASLAEAVRLMPANAQLHAAYAYLLKANGADLEAKHQFELALELDDQRTELIAEVALLAHRLNLREESIRWGRSAIDHHQSISQRQGLDGDEARQRLFNLRRAVQTEEDRFGWYADTTVRLDHGPSVPDLVSPVDYAQYGGSLNLGASYRYTPLGADLPTWAFTRASQGLDDRSLDFTPNNLLIGAGIRQRLSKDYMIVASAEYLWRKAAHFQDDAMLRLSGSNTWGGDWNPVDAQWTRMNLYGDLAWLIRQRSHFATFTGELGRVYVLPIAGKMAFMPYLGAGYAANNAGNDGVDVTRLDVGLGVALLGWHSEDSHRAPAVHQRLALEFRKAIGGNTTDRHTVQLRWTIQH